MQTRNPVLSRIGQESPSGSGFAYDEGRSAYQQATTGLATLDAAQSAPGGVAPVGTVGASVTLNDVIVKTAISLVVLVAAAVVSWQVTPAAPWLLFVAMLVGFGLALANTFKKRVSPVLVLLYAAAQGVFLGGISWFYDQMVQQVQYEGLVTQAIIGTLVAFAVMLALYSTRIIKVNGTFMRIMAVALVSYAIIAVVSLIAALFGVGGGWGFYGVGTLGLALAAFGVLLAAFTLNLDFAAIEQGVAMKLPERESWRMAFGLLVTLVWLYLEILRLLALLALNRE